MEDQEFANPCLCEGEESGAHEKYGFMCRVTDPNEVSCNDCGSSQHESCD